MRTTLHARSVERTAFTIHIEPDSQPIAGWLQGDDAPRYEFEGMIELIQLLETARTGERPRSGAPEADGQPSGE